MLFDCFKRNPHAALLLLYEPTQDHFQNFIVLAHLLNKLDQKVERILYNILVRTQQPTTDSADHFVHRFDIVERFQLSRY